MKKKIPLTFKLKQIKTEQFALLKENYKEGDKTGYNVTVQFKVNNKNKFVGCFVGFTFAQNKIPFLKIQASCHFKIEESSWKSLCDNKDSSIIIPKGFLAHLAMITVGTARGILFAKTEGTVFSKFITPTINVAEMIKEDEKFSA